ncbi:MAG: O-antigen ligase family protein [Ruminococcaceae bacterium]|nr:O-antigen ligase family protein [Oscillospiraceae bacterium]
MLDFFYRYRGNLCILVLCLYIVSPVIETVVCLFNRVERYYPLISYPIVILHIILPICILLALAVYAGVIRNIVITRRPLRPLLRENLPMVFFGLLVLWIAVDSVVTGTLGTWFEGHWYTNEPTILAVAYFLVWFACATLIRSPEQKERIALLSVVCSILVAVYALAHHFLSRAGLDASISSLPVAVFFNINHYGYYLAIHVMLAAAMFALGSKKAYRILGLAALAINTAVLNLNNTLGAWLACCAGFLFLLIVCAIVHRRFSWRALIGLGVFLVISGIMRIWTNQMFASVQNLALDIQRVVTDAEDAGRAGSGRWRIWKLTAELIAQKPIFGYGNEGIFDVLEAATKNGRPHNELLQYAVFYGIPGLVLYLCGVMSVFLAGYRARKALDGPTLLCLTGAFGYLVSSLVGNTKFYVTPLFFIFLGLGFCKDRPRRRDGTKEA